MSSLTCDGVQFKEKCPVLGGLALIPHSRGYIRGTYVGRDATHYLLTDCMVYTDFGKGLEQMESCRRACCPVYHTIRAP